MVMSACPGQIPISCVPLALMVTATMVRACRYIMVVCLGPFHGTSSLVGLGLFRTILQKLLQIRRKDENVVLCLFFYWILLSWSAVLCEATLWKISISICTIGFYRQHIVNLRIHCLLNGTKWITKKAEKGQRNKIQCESDTDWLLILNGLLLNCQSSQIPN